MKISSLTLSFRTRASDGEKQIISQGGKCDIIPRVILGYYVMWVRIAQEKLSGGDMARLSLRVAGEIRAGGTNTAATPGFRARGALGVRCPWTAGACTRWLGHGALGRLLSRKSTESSLLFMG